MRMACLLACLLLAAGPSEAQQAYSFTPEATETCLAEARGSAAQRGCIGASARTCHQAIRQADMTDIALCMTAETEYWAARMETAYGAMMARAETLDAGVDTSRPGSFRMTDDLAAMQEAWLVWREKSCAFESIQRRGKPDRMVSAANCMMKLTGEQALYLEAAVRR